MKSTRKQDNRIEGIVAGFLDRNFYGRIKDRKVERWSDRSHQLAGIDVTVGNVGIDEKCKCYGCMNAVLRYPSFEISMVFGGRRFDGWFVNPSTKTDYYSFLAIYGSANEPSELKDESQLEKVDVLLVKKSDVYGMLGDGLGRDELVRKANALISSADRDEIHPDRNGKYRLKLSDSFWLTYSPKLHEKPVNLVVPRETLESLPKSRHFTVTRDGVERA